MQEKRQIFHTEVLVLKMGGQHFWAGSKTTSCRGMSSAWWEEQGGSKHSSLGSVRTTVSCGGQDHHGQSYLTLVPGALMWWGEHGTWLWNSLSAKSVTRPIIKNKIALLEHATGCQPCHLNMLSKQGKLEQVSYPGVATKYSGPSCTECTRDKLLQIRNCK